MKWQLSFLYVAVISLLSFLNVKYKEIKMNEAIKYHLNKFGNLKILFLCFIFIMTRNHVIKNKCFYLIRRYIVDSLGIIKYRVKYVI